MKASELARQDDGALSKELQDLLRAQFSVRMQAATQQLDQQQPDQENPP